MTKGPDGNLWFTEWRDSDLSGFIGRITPAGAITEFPKAGFATEITTGPDGNLWFIIAGNGIGRITPSGQITQFDPSAQGGQIGNLAVGPDGNLWFTNYDRVGRITPTGTSTKFSIPYAGQMPETWIAAGPDGNLRFGLSNTAADQYYGTITTAGVMSESLTAPFGCLSLVNDVDNSLWCGGGHHTISRLTPPGVSTVFTVPPGSFSSFVAGPDGNLWSTLTNSNQIVRSTPSGATTTFGVQTASYPTWLTLGSDNNLWFLEEFSNKVGRITQP